jgi:hypothetical protein
LKVLDPLFRRDDNFSELWDLVVRECGCGNSAGRERAGASLLPLIKKAPLVELVANL